MATLATHPRHDLLVRFGRGELPEDESAEIERHVAECSTCAASLGGVTADSLIELVQKSNQSPGIDVPAELADHPRYRIISPLGAGGMGTVYKAEHRVMGRLVAVKVVSPRLVNNAVAVERFRREVRAAAKLSHPNIVTAHDADEAGGSHFLVMEYVDGVSLDRYVARRGPLSVQIACHFIRQVALGLQHAHSQSMVHRDIKPQNVMITRKGVVKVMDFGLARLAREVEEEANLPSAAVTSASMVMGTPDYLSPEQARSARDVDGRSDIYSLGCTFYFLLTGKVPFADATTTFDKMLAHTQKEPPPIDSFRSDVPEGVVDIVRKMMAKKRDLRFETPADVAAALVSWSRGVDPAATMVERIKPMVLPLDDESASAVERRSARPIQDTPIDVVTDLDIVPESKPDIAVDRPPVRRKKRRIRRRSQLPLWIGSIAAVLAMLLMMSVVVKPWRWGRDTGLSATSSKGTMSASQGRGATTADGASTPRVLIVLPSRELYYPDYGPVRQALERGGAVVTTAAPTTGAISLFAAAKSTDAPEVRADRLLAEVDGSQYDAILFVGADVSEYIPGGGSTFQKVRQLIESMVNSQKTIAAICTGNAVLLRGDWVRGRRVSRCTLIGDDPYQKSGAVPVPGQGVVADGRLVTASDANHAEQFGREILRITRGR